MSSISCRLGPSPMLLCAVLMSGSGIGLDLQMVLEVFRSCSHHKLKIKVHISISGLGIRSIACQPSLLITKFKLMSRTALKVYSQPKTKGQHMLQKMHTLRKHLFGLEAQLNKQIAKYASLSQGKYAIKDNNIYAHCLKESCQGESKRRNHSEIKRHDYNKYTLANSSS